MNNWVRDAIKWISIALLMGVHLCRGDATGLRKEVSTEGKEQFLVIDLSGGPSATTYPVRYSGEGPDLSKDSCRTTELWLRLIPQGTFTMGSPESESGHAADETLHRVTISKSFYMGVFEVTQKQWKLVMGENPSYNRGDTRPVEYITYNDIRGADTGSNWPSSEQVDAYSFLGKIRARTNLNLDLPTEAQWEYACRAGTTTALNNGKDLEDLVNDAGLAELGRYLQNRKEDNGGYVSASTKVGSFQPNAWGLYDMHGNAWEWCRDWYEDYAIDKEFDPVGASSGPCRVLRGGEWYSKAQDCRSAKRFSCYPSQWLFNFFGFRLCCYPGQ